LKIIGFLWIKERDLDFDYTPYLGPDYKKDSEPAVVISNHSSLMECVYFVARFAP